MNKLILGIATACWALLFYLGYQAVPDGAENCAWFFLFAGVAQWVCGVFVERIFNERLN